VPPNVQTGAVRNIGVVMATQANVANQAPLPGIGEMVHMLVRMDALQITMALLAG
jgi:hypothetical protein